MHAAKEIFQLPTRLHCSNRFRHCCKTSRLDKNFDHSKWQCYEEGLKDDFWIPIKAYWQNRSKENEAAIRKSLTIDATKRQYTHGVRNIETISSDNWLIDQPLIEPPGNYKIELQVFYSYHTNPTLYPQ